MKKKILFVINTLGGAGAEAALVALLHLLDPMKYDISVFVLTNQGELIHRLPDYVRVRNVFYDDSSVLTDEGKKRLKKHVLRIGLGHGSVFKNVPYLVKNFKCMLKKGKVQPDKLLWRVLSDGAERMDEKFDLAVAYLEGGSAYYVADHIKADKKAVFVHIDYNMAGYTRSLDKDCYLCYDKIFSVSEEVRQQFLKVYPECERKTAVFHNIIDQEELRRKAKLPGGFSDDFQGIRILTVGRLSTQKAYEVSIDAMRLLKDKGENIRWYVLGEGSERKKLEEQIERLGLQEDFILMGAVENPYPYYDQTDLYVHASRFEGKSIAIQEAQTLGCPVLVSDCSGNREQVTEGVDGLMCDLTPESICGGILEYINDPEKRKLYGENAAKKRIDARTDLDQLLSMLE
ncbi:MAG: glycosyltransferase [Lachnospiraceae bacterium]|nr:glycosyltransferase [Lachnospiraceae bacterium]